MDREIQTAAASARKGFDGGEGENRRRMNSLKANLHRAEHKLDVKLAEKRAEDLEWEAASQLAGHRLNGAGEVCGVLDAIEGRQASEEAKRAA